MIEWSMLTSQNECRRVVQDMSKAKQCSSGRRSKGSKSEPCCASCGSTGHYSTSCPTLAAKLLSAVTRTHGTRQVKEFLKSQKPAKLLGCEHKKKRRRSREPVANDFSNATQYLLLMRRKHSRTKRENEYVLARKLGAHLELRRMWKNKVGFQNVK